MSQPLSNSEADVTLLVPRNRWAVVDLLVFGLFFGLLFLVLVLLSGRLAGLPVIYAILLQGVFNVALVGFIAGWIHFVRHTSIVEYIHFVRSRVFSTKSLIVLGAGCAMSVILVSHYLPSSGQTPLEKLLTTKTAILTFAFFGVAVAPLLEEVIFRGFLFQVLSEIGGSRIAIPVTAALFAILHAGQLAGNMWSVALIFVVGCVLSVVRHRSNSMISSLIVHTSYNSMLFGLFALSSLLQALK